MVLLRHVRNLANWPLLSLCLGILSRNREDRAHPWTDYTCSFGSLDADDVLIFLNFTATFDVDRPFSLGAVLIVPHTVLGLDRLFFAFFLDLKIAPVHSPRPLLRRIGYHGLAPRLHDSEG